MTFHPLLFLLLLGHVIGNFYAQTKTSKEKWFAHGLRYSLATAVVLFPVVQFSLTLVYIFLAVSILHFILSSVKRFIKWKPFIVEQALHIAAIFLVWIIFNDDIVIWAHVVELNLLSENPYWTLLGVLVLLRPVGYLIKSNEVWDFGSTPEKVGPNAGRMIGYLERLIVFFLILNNALGTIGFILAAKAAMRIPEIISAENEIEKRNQVEYFLIGTLLSMICVFVVYLLLRLTV